MINVYFDKIGKEWGIEAILVACDMSGVLQKEYSEIYKTIKGRVQIVDPRLKPNLHKVPTYSPHFISSIYTILHEFNLHVVSEMHAILGTICILLLHCMQFFLYACNFSSGEAIWFHHKR